MRPLERMMQKSMDNASNGPKILPEADIYRLREADAMIAAREQVKP